jgi:NADH dehydrogenase FAD-containing subunit
VIGKPRVTGVVVEDTRTHRQETIKCDTVVFTADWIPDNELSRLGGLSIDKESLSPIVDISLRTTREGVFAAGNLAHPVDVADAASWDGLKAAESVRRFLQGGATPSEGAEIVAEAPLRWIAPRIVRPDDHSPARGRFLSWTDDYIATPMVTVEQDGKVLKGMRLPWAAAPGRAFRIPQQLFANVDPLGGKVTVRMV